MTTLVLTHPGTIRAEQADAMREQLEEWQAGPRDRPLILAEGMTLGIIGGLTFRVKLTEGPLDGLTFAINVPSLTDLPPTFDYLDGFYKPWVASDGGQMHTTAGDPCYIWSPVVT